MMQEYVINQGSNTFKKKNGESKIFLINNVIIVITKYVHNIGLSLNYGQLRILSYIFGSIGNFGNLYNRRNQYRPYFGFGFGEILGFARNIKLII